MAKPTLKEIHGILKKEHDLRDFILIKIDNRIIVTIKESHGSRVRSSDAVVQLNKKFKGKGLFFRSQQVEDFYPIGK
jgi:hypothetical protein